MTDHVESGVKCYAPPVSARRENTVLVFGVTLFSVLIIFLGWLGWRMQPDGLQIAYFVFFGLLFLVLLGALLREWRHRFRNRQQCALLADDDGLWSAHLGRDAALVRWTDIDDAQYEINTTHSALTLLGRHQALLRIDGRLCGYAELCGRVFDHMQRPVLSLPQTYRSGWRWMEVILLPVAAFMIWSAISGEIEVMLVPLVFFALSASEVYAKFDRLTVDEQGLTLAYRRFRKPVHYRWDEIDSVTLQAVPQTSNVVLYARLRLKNGQTVLLDGFPGHQPGGPIPCIDLYRLLRWQLNQSVKTPATTPAVPPHPPAVSTTN